MRMTNIKLKAILMEHKDWLRNKGGRRADLSGVDLSGVDLSGAVLCRVNLSGANLSRANLSRADLIQTNLVGTDLSDANLSGANLDGAILVWANLSRANLGWTTLTDANFSNAKLGGVNFESADLSQVDFSTAYKAPYIPLVCPDTGSFIAWKKASKYIIKLLIPEDAKRSSATSRKCRADKAIVLAIENLDGTPSEISEIQSNFDSNFIYRIGETVEVMGFCNNRFKQCAAGIHFFINREEAVNYGG